MVGRSQTETLYTSNRFLPALVVAALLGAIASAIRAEGPGPYGSAPALVRSQMHGASAALPAQIIAASVATGGEVSGMRNMPSRTSARYGTSERTSHLAPMRPFRNLDQHFWNMSARLGRSGMDNSSLNTPPPQTPTDPAAS